MDSATDITGQRIVPDGVSYLSPPTLAVASITLGEGEKRVKGLVSSPVKVTKQGRLCIDPTLPLTGQGIAKEPVELKALPLQLASVSIAEADKVSQEIGFSPSNILELAVISAGSD